MSIEIVIPRLGWSMEEGNFTGWLKKEDEFVRAGEPLFTLESEKASQDVESIDSGFLCIPREAPQAGAVVRVGQVIGLLISQDEKANSKTIAPQKKAESNAADLTRLTQHEAATSNTVSSNAQHRLASSAAISPRARRRAAELGVDISAVKGSGRTGRIIEADVLSATQRTFRAATTSTMRRTIAQRTAASFAAAPHFYLRAEIDVTALLALREELLPEIARSTGIRLTLTDLLLRAQAFALSTFPFANSIWQQNDIIRSPTYDVGLVVGVPDGLLIPIVRSPGRQDIGSLAKQRSSLVESARAGKLNAEALQGGATSLSNLGNTLVDEFSAVLPAPHSSILAIGRVAPRPFPLDGRLSVRPTLKLCLSVDHRVMDGKPASEFFGRIIELLQTPRQLIESR